MTENMINQNDFKLLKLMLDFETIKYNHESLKKEIKKSNKMIKKLKKEKKLKKLETSIFGRESFVKKDQEKNYINNILYKLVEETYYNLNVNSRPCNLGNKFVSSLYKWLIDEDIDVETLVHCNYSDVKDDLKESNIINVHKEFWNGLQKRTESYLKYGKCTTMCI